MTTTPLESVSISELARLLNTSKSSLRYYEREGLVHPDRIKSNGYRSYSFNSVVELTDIMIYRSLGVPVKEIRRLMDSPIEETDAALESAEVDLIDQLSQVEQGLRMIAGRRNMIRRFRLAQAEGSHLVERPGIEALYPFSIDKPTDLGSYVSDPRRTRYTALFTNAEKSEDFIDCSAESLDGSEPVWTTPRRRGPWLECLMQTDYNVTERNNLARHVAYLRELGHEPGCAIAEYLTFSAETDGVRHDYYLCWIEAR